MMDGAGGTLHYPHETPPGPDGAIEVAPGVLWLRQPLPMALDHVNIYALDDGDGWTLVDAGAWTNKSVGLWETLLAGPLADKPVHRVLITHHHPDHIGMLGWFMERGAEHVTSRTSYLYSRMLTLDEESEVSPAALSFWRAAGMPEDRIAAKRAERPFNFADIVHPIPVGYRRLKEGDVFRAGGRDWDVRMGAGHAPEHVTLWSRDDDLVIGGDQLLPSISPNVGVSSGEPEGDPLSDWMEACERLAAHAEERHFVLPGHKLPYTGLPTRMRQLISNHHGALRRLKQHLAEPRTAVDCFPPLFKRKIDDGTYNLAMIEAYAHLNHLFYEGEITRERREDGAWVWSA